jgi:hypothetical protein
LDRRTGSENCRARCANHVCGHERTRAEVWQFKRVSIALPTDLQDAPSIRARRSFQISLRSSDRPRDLDHQWRLRKQVFV